MANPEALTPEQMIQLADDWLEEAESSIFNEERGGWALARKANKLRTKAAKAMPDGPALLSLLIDIAFLASNLEDHRRVCWAVRKAVECNPDDDQTDELKDYWECSAWGRDAGAFPEPALEAEKPWKPAPGQMSFLEDS